MGPALPGGPAPPGSAARCCAPPPPPPPPAPGRVPQSLPRRYLTSLGSPRFSSSPPPSPSPPPPFGTAVPGGGEPLGAPCSREAAPKQKVRTSWVPPSSSIPSTTLQGGSEDRTSSSPCPPPPPPGHVQPSALPGAQLGGSSGVQGEAEETSRPPAPAAPRLPPGPRRGDAALVSARSAGESRGAATWGQQRFAGGDGGGRSLEDLIRLFFVLCDAGEKLLRAGVAFRAGLRAWAEGSALLPAPSRLPTPDSTNL